MRICQPEFRKSRTRRIGAQAGPPCHHLPGQPTLIPPRVCRDRSRSATSLSSPPPAPTVYTELRSVYTERSRSPQMSHRLDPDQVTTAVLSSTLLSMFAGGSMKVSHVHCRVRDLPAAARWFQQVLLGQLSGRMTLAVTGLWTTQ